MRTIGVGLRRRPDIVIPGPDPDTWILLDVKTLDSAGDTFISRQHTDRIRGAAHAHVELSSARYEYGPLD